MSCGLFGKLPGKRDFIALGAPSAFLSVYEPWLQGGLTASRLELGAGWQDAFLNAFQSLRHFKGDACTARPSPAPSCRPSTASAAISR